MNSHDLLLIADGVLLGVLWMIALYLAFEMVDARRARRANEAALRMLAEREQA
jgi:hypothetical protein